MFHQLQVRPELPNTQRKYERMLYDEDTTATRNCALQAGEDGWAPDPRGGLWGEGEMTSEPPDPRGVLWGEGREGGRVGPRSQRVSLGRGKGWRSTRSIALYARRAHSTSLIAISGSSDHFRGRLQAV